MDPDGRTDWALFFGGLGVGFGTIIEDILTWGAGIADDPATLALAAAMIIAATAVVTETKVQTERRTVSIHHIFTDKNCISGSRWTLVFQPIFDAAGIDISKSSLNLVAVEGHYGPHPEEYHVYVYTLLIAAIQGLKPGSPEYKAAVTAVLLKLQVEYATPGTYANSLITRGGSPID